MPSRHSRESGNPGNPLPQTGGGAPAQRSAGGGGGGGEKRSPATTLVTPPPNTSFPRRREPRSPSRHSRPPPSFSRPTVIPAKAGTQETPARLREGTRQRSDAQGRRTPRPQLPPSPQITRHSPRKRESRHRHPSHHQRLPQQVRGEPVELRDLPINAEATAFLSTVLFVEEVMPHFGTASPCQHSRA